MSVTLNARSSGVSANNAISTHDHANLTIAAGTDTGLVVFIGGNGPSSFTVTSVTWDQGGTNQAMTLIRRADSATSGDMAALYGLLAPTTGNKTLRVVLSAARDCYVYAMAFDGVNQTDIATAFQEQDVEAQGTTDPATLAITNASGDYSVSLLVPTAVSPQSVSGATQEFISTALNNINAAGASSAATNPTHSYDLSATGEWVLVGASIKAAAGGPALTIVGRTVLDYGE